jgi:hypothetical protein
MGPDHVPPPDGGSVKPDVPCPGVPGGDAAPPPFVGPDPPPAGVNFCDAPAINANTGVDVAVGVREAVGVDVSVGVGVCIDVFVGIGTGVSVGPGIGVVVGTGVGASVGTGVGFGVGVSVGVGFGVDVGVGVSVGVGAGVGVGVSVAVGAGVGVGVSVGVGISVDVGVGVSINVGNEAVTVSDSMGVLAKSDTFNDIAACVVVVSANMPTIENASSATASAAIPTRSLLVMNDPQNRQKRCCSI